MSATLWLAAAALAVAPQERVVVGSKNFAESRLLAEVFAQLIEERTELEVERKTGLGGTLLVFTALRSGEIDLYPEYTGTGWAVLLERTEEITDPLRTYLEVRRRTRERFDLTWLDPLGPNNTYAIAMREELAQELGVTRLSELAPHAARLRAGFGPEFFEREDGWRGLAARYGLEEVSVRSIDHGLAYDALAEGAIDLIDAYATDGRLAHEPVRVLEDDRRYFPPYDVAPLCRPDVLERHPEVREVLELLAFRLDDERMRALNEEVEIEGRRFDQVAREFLRAEGLIGPARAHEEASATRGRWSPSDLLPRLLEHLRMTFLAVLLAALVGLPLGVWSARNRWTARLSLGTASMLQTIPSLALLAILIAVPGLGLSDRSAIVALTLYAVLPILRNTFAGVRSVDPAMVDAARGLGLTERQILLHVQLPLAVRTILAGLRTATVITIGFATLAAFIGAGGLGQPIVTGLYLNDVQLILSGAIPAALLALLAEGVLGGLERALTPRGLRLGSRADGA